MKVKTADEPKSRAHARQLDVSDINKPPIELVSI